MITITPSGIKDYLFCPWKYKLSRQIPKLVIPASPESVLGETIHDAINRFLYQILNDNQRMQKARAKRLAQGKNDVYFYQSAGSFLRFSAGLIIEAFKGADSQSTLIRRKQNIRWPENATEEEIVALKEKFLLMGLAMLRDYYRANLGKPAPFLREQSIKVSLSEEISPGIMLSGRIDQARRNSQSQVYIVDLKTGFDRLEWQLSRIANSEAAALTLLEIDPQISAYWMLYEKIFGEPPYRAGFYYLRNGKHYFAKRTPAQIESFLMMIRLILMTGERELFLPLGMNDQRCRYCDYRDHCKHFKQTEKIEPLTIEEIEEGLPETDQLKDKLAEEFKESDYQQLRLKLRAR